MSLATVPVTYIRDPDVQMGNGTIVLDVMLANDAKSPSTTILPVQIVDDQGNVLRQSTLEGIYASVSSGTLYESMLFNAASGPGSSPAAYVGGRTKHCVQHVITGTVMVQTRSSLDGAHWHVEAVDTQSVVHAMEGATKYLSAEYVSGTGILTTLITSAR